MKTVFDAILAHEIPHSRRYEDEFCIVIDDLHPAAPLHLLIIPKKRIACLDHAEEDDQWLLGHLLYTAQHMAKVLNLATGYRVVINQGPDALQSVYHLHVHLLAQRGFAWPPG